MSKHTPGPWQYAFEGGTTAFITEADGSTIICIRTTENTTAHKNLAANARLMAAAPELLAAIERLAPILDRAESNASGNPEWADVSERINAARAAIEKATAG